MKWCTVQVGCIHFLLSTGGTLLWQGSVWKELWLHWWTEIFKLHVFSSCQNTNRSHGMWTVVFSAVPCGVEMLYGVVEVTRTRQRCHSTLAIKNLNNQNLQVRGLLELQILVMLISCMWTQRRVLQVTLKSKHPTNLRWHECGDMRCCLPDR